MELVFQDLCKISNTLASSANNHSRFRGVDHDSRADRALGELDVAVPGAFQLECKVFVDFEASRNIFDKILGN
jgi:hypothetical protein